MASFQPSQNAADVQGSVQNYLTESYIKRLNAQGQNVQNAILTNSPLLKQINDFFTDRFSNPVPKALQDSFADTIRGAQSARGFGGAGTGVAGEEARFLTGVAEQQRMQLIQPAQQFARSLLEQGGVGHAEQFSQQDAFNQTMQYKQFRLQHAQFNNARNMGYVNAAISAVGAVTGGGGIIGAVQSQQRQQQQQQPMDPAIQRALDRLDRRGGGSGGGSAYGKNALGAIQDPDDLGTGRTPLRPYESVFGY
jgi:hypothetical protein